MDSRLKLILKGNPEEELMLLIRLKNPKAVVSFCQVITQFEDVISCRVKRKNLLEVYNSPDTLSVKAPRLIPAPLSKEDVDVSNDDITDKGLSRQFKTGYSGDGIYFATIDWGFDIAHANLRNVDGTTRFKHLWDQNGKYDGNKYGYGCFYSDVEINEALKTDTPYDTLKYHPGRADIMGSGMHGTHVVDVATGTRIIGEGGVAPKTTIVAVQLGSNYVNGSDMALGDSVRLVEALDFIKSVTTDAPCVINMSLGSHGDSHTGKSLVEIVLDNFLIKHPGYAIVQSVGNYYQANCHLEYKLKNQETYNIDWNIPKRNPSPNEVEIWYDGADKFSINLLSPRGDIVANVSPFEDIEISLQKNPIGYIFHRSKEPNTDMNHIDIILDSELKGKWIIQVIGIEVYNGFFHAYCERNDVGQAKFSQRQSSPLNTTGSICNGEHTITVGAYNHYESNKPMVSFSSSGPTLFGQAKPDLLAPGYKILAARSASAFNFKPTHQLTTKSGSSMAAPHIAGAIALLFQKHLPKKLTIQETKYLLFNSLDFLPTYFSPQDRMRGGNGMLNITKLLGSTQINTMKNSNLTRPTRRQTEIEDEDFFENESFHAPYLHENCEGCESALIESFDENNWGNKPDLLNAFNEAYFDGKELNSFNLYRNFARRYPFLDNDYHAQFALISQAGEYLVKDLLRIGDIILSRDILSGRTFEAIITNTDLLHKQQIVGFESNSNKLGYFLEVYGNMGGSLNKYFYMQIANEQGVIKNHMIILRKNASQNSLDHTIPKQANGYIESDFADDFNSYEANEYLEDTENEGLSFLDEDLVFVEEKERKFKNISQLGVTDYLNVSAVKGHAFKTGVFIPTYFKQSDKVDVVVYMHGLYKPHGDDQNGMSVYWNDYANIRAFFHSSNRNAILIAPTLSSNPQTENIFKNGFDNFMYACLEELKAKNYLSPNAVLNQIILAGHSAGGSPISKILNSSSRVAQNIVECWGFDCHYGYDFSGWLKHNPTKTFYHYWSYSCKDYNSNKCPRHNGEAYQKRYSNFKNIEPQKTIGHQAVIEYAWQNEINQRQWFNHNGAGSSGGGGLHSKTGFANPQFRNVNNESQEMEDDGSGFKKVQISLSDTPIVLVKENRKKGHAEIKEAPSVFVKQILQDAGEDADDWMNSFTKTTFLGRPLAYDQYIHVKLAEHLKKVEANFAHKFGGTNADIKVAGDFLLGSKIQDIKGSRKVSLTATYSYHMFGLAVDINYLENPFVQKIDTINTVLARACDLLQKDRIIKFSHHEGYDKYAFISDFLVEYFSLSDKNNESKLTNLLNNYHGNGSWGITLERAIARIKADLINLSTSLSRSKNSEFIKNNGFLNLPKEFIDGIKLNWGGEYGDMMHFDMRDVAGSGSKITKSISNYRHKKEQESQEKFKKQHG